MMKLQVLIFTFFVVHNKGILVSASFKSYRDAVQRKLNLHNHGSVSGASSSSGQFTAINSGVGDPGLDINVAGAIGVNSLAPNVQITQQPTLDTVIKPGSLDAFPTFPVGGFASGSPSTIQKGIECGYQELSYGRILQLSSRNFNEANYFNNEACTWKFQADRCTLSVFCPCVDFPSSPFCLEDYLRITDKYNFDQRYCGGNQPNVTALTSSSDTLTIKYRTNRRITATGFTCIVACGPASGLVPSNFPFTCPGRST